MRIDLFLKCVCLAKSRSAAARSVEQGRVLVNGGRAKPSRDVKAGDVLEVTVGRSLRKIKVLEVPTGQVSKAAAKDFYELIEEKRVDDELW